jgi:hypothetical protein
MEANVKNVAKKYVRNSISEHLKKDLSPDSIIDDLNLRCNNMIKSLEKRQDDLDVFSNLFLGLENPDSERVEKRIRYMFFYISNAKEQIKNLKWLIKNKEKFNHLNNYKLYKLSLLKEKLSKENSIWLPF